RPRGEEQPHLVLGAELPGEFIALAIAPVLRFRHHLRGLLSEPVAGLQVITVERMVAEFPLQAAQRAVQGAVYRAILLLDDGRLHGQSRRLALDVEIAVNNAIGSSQPLQRAHGAIRESFETAPVVEIAHEIENAFQVQLGVAHGRYPRCPYKNSANGKPGLYGGFPPAAFRYDFGAPSLNIALSCLRNS